MTVPISLKRLAEIKEALTALWNSDTPTRVKRFRERLLRQEADYITLQEELEPVADGMCTRCRELASMPDTKFCYPCVCHYLDAIPKWARAGAVTQEWADASMAELMQYLLKHNLIGIPEVDFDDNQRQLDTTESTGPTSSEPD